MDEPNVLFLDEPTNDLDIETPPSWRTCSTVGRAHSVLVSHDRYFLERITDHVMALMGDGSLVLLPGGVDEYLRRRAEVTGRGAVPVAASEAASDGAVGPEPTVSAAERRAAQKEMQRVERRMDRIGRREGELHELMAEAADDYARLADLDAEAKTLATEREALEEVWLEQAEFVED